MENARESFTLSILDHIITPPYPARNYELKSIPHSRPFSFERVELISLSAIGEERFCLDYYGDAYRNYMERTPRWIGLPKSK